MLQSYAGIERQGLQVGDLTIQELESLQWPSGDRVETVRFGPPLPHTYPPPLLLHGAVLQPLSNGEARLSPLLPSHFLFRQCRRRIRSFGRCGRTWRL